MDELTTRNFHTLADGLKQQRDENSKQNIKIVSLEAKIAELNKRIDTLQSRLNSFLCRLGTGPTAR